MFRVTTLDLNELPRNDKGEIDFSKDFFNGNKPHGQWPVIVAHAMAFGKIYTFGPTFRAENSNTARHAAEFS